ncbi:MAG: Na+:solute symporter [Sedimentisphaerales bacterium]|nr:Na+:solute symporter [Sedimentisphaerales bacterium]
MELHTVDKGIIIGYIAIVILMGWFLSKRASRNLESYFLGGKSLPWWIIGISHGASGFDITGTMWFVMMLFTYGVKAAWIPLIWPLFDRVFRQVYLGPWIRRSNVLTGAEWMRTRFGYGLGGDLSHISVVIYALIATVGFLSYAFQGIGKFAEVFFPWNLEWGPFASSDVYAIIILIITTAYLLLGGWYSVVLTDVVQFVLLTVASIFIAAVAMYRVSPDMLSKAVPEGWNNLFFGWKMDLDWSGLIDQLNQKIVKDGYSLFGIVIMMMFFKGLLVSMAGPTPGYGIQHVLSTRSPREAALENWWMSVVQLFPRFLMITGIAMLGLVFFSPNVQEILARGDKVDFEQILPLVIRDFVPAGLVGILMAGLLAAFMSTFDSTVNAGAAYIVNDIYKSYIRKDAPVRRYVWMSYLCSVLLVVVAIIVGMNVKSIHSITNWITFALYGGYVAPNILKWHWWRFNGYGFAAGMIGGVIASMIPLAIWPDMNRMYILPFSLAASTIASVTVCLLTPPEEDAILCDFYRTVRPWGVWTPVLEQLRQIAPGIEKNKNLPWDAFNVAVGIIWQITLMVIPICLVIREYRTMCGAIIVLVVTSVIMKFTWYDNLGPGEMYVSDDS